MLSDHHRITWRRNIAENFNRLSRVHERYRRQTTDGRTTTYSEREHEFTFAKNAVDLYRLCYFWTKEFENFLRRELTCTSLPGTAYTEPLLERRAYTYAIKSNQINLFVTHNIQCTQFTKPSNENIHIMCNGEYPSSVVLRLYGLPMY